MVGCLVACMHGLTGAGPPSLPHPPAPPQKKRKRKNNATASTTPPAHHSIHHSYDTTNIKTSRALLVEPQDNDITKHMYVHKHKTTVPPRRRCEGRGVACLPLTATPSARARFPRKLSPAPAATTAARSRAPASDVTPPPETRTSNISKDKPAGRVGNEKKIVHDNAQSKACTVMLYAHAPGQPGSQARLHTKLTSGVAFFVNSTNCRLHAWDTHKRLPQFSANNHSSVTQHDKKHKQLSNKALKTKEREHTRNASTQLKTTKNNNKKHNSRG